MLEDGRQSQTVEAMETKHSTGTRRVIESICSAAIGARTTYKPEAMLRSKHSVERADGEDEGIFRSDEHQQEERSGRLAEQLNPILPASSTT